MSSGLPQPATSIAVGSCLRSICHECQRTARLLDSLTANSRMEWYRCDHCCYVWTYEKNNPDGARHEITRSTHAATLRFLSNLK